jgi:CRP/FNR family cyclic AMP-dependent transcriptional regulator
MELEDLERHLRQAFLFSGLDREHLHELARRMIPVQYAPGDEIITEGDPGPFGGMGVVLSGSLKVLHQRDQVVGHIQAGEIFGEMSLIDNRPRSATVVAETEVEAAILSPGDFRQELGENPDIAIRLLGMLCDRLREAEALPLTHAS